MFGIGILAMIITITNSFGSAKVDTLGARIVSYIPRGGSEVFAMFSDGTGGMPICAPYFASLGPEGSPRHGPARRQEFREAGKLSNGEELVLKLVAESDDKTRLTYSGEYRIEIGIRLGRELSETMRIVNRGNSPLVVTPAFHPYFRVADAERCRVEGELGEMYAVRPGPAHIIDFPTTRREYSLVDPVLGRRFEFRSSGDRQVAVWTPGDAQTPEQRARTMSKFKPGEWRTFVAVENGLLRRESALTLSPGEQYELGRTIRTITQSR